MQLISHLSHAASVVKHSHVSHASQAERRIDIFRAGIEATTSSRRSSVPGAPGSFTLAHAR